MALSIVWRGLQEAQAAVAYATAQAATWGRAAIGVTATEPYAHFIEMGFYAGGRPGRTTPIHYLQRAQQDARPLVLEAAARSMLPGGLGADAAIEQVSERMKMLAQQYVTVRSGRLRGSIVARRGTRLFR